MAEGPRLGRAAYSRASDGSMARTRPQVPQRPTSWGRRGGVGNTRVGPRALKAAFTVCFPRKGKGKAGNKRTRPLFSWCLPRSASKLWASSAKVGRSAASVALGPVIFLIRLLRCCVR